ncbi:MAG: UvrD-helicase domain-containing protein [Prevotella sp.]|uniref:UvrD-helicase domain-containing protein n=1 Tax=Prevotella sp. TaxID=59823 RepID=UPI002A27B2B3|nr:UvrD-helicase domain-containing protein [Prevotella sp.]MDD7317884.1 UvrD-helicase domain-containing protein [Prevotellaceae bacterium]MDY4019673.1 UvrD-helicase domain-containing protein [Prevotella sp.]
MQLTVYKASAGSGKTFRLAVEYIKLLIKNPEHGHRDILAVTFTNKATEEMKERIMSQLYGIRKQLPDSETYLNTVSEELDIDRQEVSRRAGIALSHLIHDFDHFRVQTIDKFFQSVMRNLAHELGLASNLRVGLNDIQVEEMAVDQMIEQLSDKDKELAWIIEYISKNISENKSWNVTSQIKNFGRTIFKDVYKERREEINIVVGNEDSFKLFSATMHAIIKDFEDEMAGYEPKFMKILDDNGVDVSELKKTPCGYFTKLKDKKFTKRELEKSSYTEAMENPEGWVTKDMAKQRPDLLDFAEEHLMPLLIEVNDKVKDNIKRYNTAKMSLTYINQLRLLSAIEKKVVEVNGKANRFLLSDTQQLLSEFIKDSDSPFIYEKIGTQISHIMIDEFQDTSTVQWKNFLVLLEDCMSRANPGVGNVAQNLIVGDVKQSIYRWRSGDWQLLNNIEKNIGKDKLKVEPMDCNFRSAGNIVRFNNAFFETAVRIETEAESEICGDKAQELEKAYHDVAQKMPEGGREGGLVHITLFPNDDYQERTLEKIVETVDELVAKNVPLKRIAILLRTNREITLIAEKFMRDRAEINIVSDEAFRLDASLAVRMMIESLHLLLHPEDLLSRATLAKQYQRHIMKNSMPEGDMLCHADEEKINALLPRDFTESFDKMIEMPLVELIEYVYKVLRLDSLNDQSAYVCAFYDAVNEFAEDYSPGIETLLKEWEENMHSKNIQSDEIEGIRLLTIHKSKGLEFDNVILPFASWETGSKGMIWCHTEESPFSQMPLIPVRYSQEMNNSYFAEDYRQEHLQTTVDNMNMLYVAFTRAANNLYVIGMNGGKANRSYVIKRSLGEVADKLDGALLSGECGDAEKKGREKPAEDIVFSYGEFKAGDDESRKESSNVFLQKTNKIKVDVATFPMPVSFRQSNKSVEFTMSEEDAPDNKAYIKRGNILHNIFSQIVTAGDVERVIREMEQEGILYDELSREDILSAVRKCLDNPVATEWFSGRWKTFRECPVLEMEDGRLVEHRPDRVMTDGEKTIVVDYKFGTQRTSHENQICRYMKLLDEMGQQNIKGYLWYVDKNIIKEFEN